jgi:hypothetical protein
VKGSYLELGSSLLGFPSMEGVFHLEPVLSMFLDDSRISD